MYKPTAQETERRQNGLAKAIVESLDITALPQLTAKGNQKYHSVVDWVDAPTSKDGKTQYGYVKVTIMAWDAKSPDEHKLAAATTKAIGKIADDDLDAALEALMARKAAKDAK
jgi:hypothetical protein